MKWFFFSLKHINDREVAHYSLIDANTDTLSSMLCIDAIITVNKFDNICHNSMNNSKYFYFWTSLDLLETIF